jgi:hypothetical protein
MASPCTDSFIWKKLELELRGLTPGVVGGITEIIDQMMGKFSSHFSKNRSQPILSAQSPTRSYLLAPAE